MDSEHRHELAENDLHRFFQTLGEKYEGYIGAAVAAVIALVAVFLGSAYLNSESTAANQAAWQQLASASVAENYAVVAEDNPGTKVAAWARFNEGRLYLQEGIREMFSDRESALASLDRAKAAYQAVLANPAAPDEALEEALLGLATHAEAISDGDTTAAIAAYKKLLSQFPDTTYKGYANERMETLSSESAQKFYAWFSEQKPAPSDATGALDGLNLDIPLPPSATDSDDAADDDDVENKPMADTTAEDTPEKNPFEPDTTTEVVPSAESSESTTESQPAAEESSSSEESVSADEPTAESTEEPAGE